MSSNYALGKKAIAECDRCGIQYKLKELKTLTIKTKNVNLLVCPTCWEPDNPQLQLGMYRVEDPQALRDPRPDTSYEQSRDIQWGWDPVGFNNPLSLSGLEDMLKAQGAIGTVTVSTE